jgi:uncharacterized membrane protein YbaN (DUF454 family)
MQTKEAISEINVSQKPIVRWTLMFAGTVLVGIGILGIFLPLLPTTVFFLMAAWCYARSSKKFYDWLHHNKVFGKYLKNYREGKGITLSGKVSTIVMLWGGILYSIFVTQSFAVQMLLAAIAIAVTIHIVVIPTNKSEE